MRLSEAIRLGAMLHPQTYRDYRTRDAHGVTGTCALGAAEEAGFPDPMTYLHELRTWCPGCPANGPLPAVIAHLNDQHRWTREAIADWVETIEPERQPADVSATSTNAVAQADGAPVPSLRA